MSVTSAVIAEDVVLRHGATVALHRSSFAIPLGATCAVIGPNGSGKSSLLNLISGLRPPSSGRLRVLDLSPVRARRQVAYVLQTTEVNAAMPVTVHEITSMGRYSSLGLFSWTSSADRQAISEAIEAVNLSSEASTAISDLSGGQRQRAFVAQGLAQEHQVLLLDEPFSGLDAISELSIRSVIESERSDGITVVITTHDIRVAESADQVILLSSRVIASGTPAEVLTPANLREAYGPAGSAVWVDDPAHEPIGRRHVHRERSIHPEAPGSDLHPDK